MTRDGPPETADDDVPTASRGDATDGGSPAAGATADGGVDAPSDDRAAGGVDIPSDDRADGKADAPDAALDGSAANADTTVVAVGTSVTWGTGNRYENKYPNLVHRDLNGGYPDDEAYLHYDDGSGPPGDPGDPTPSYYRKTVDDGYAGGGHPRGPQIPPVQYRARGGAIIGLSRPIRTEFGTDWADVQRNDAGGYLASGPDGEYDGLLDFERQHYSDVYDPTDINESEWLVTRDIGWAWPTIVDQLEQFQHRGEAPNTLDVPHGKVRQFGGRELANHPPDAEDVDVLIIDGGTNDLALGWLNNPLSAGRHEIWQGVRRHQYEDMVGPDGLVGRARRRFPNAVVVLVGDPVWASNRTDHRKARAFLAEKQTGARLFPGAVEQALDNALNFARFSVYWQRRAVAEEARDDDGPGILFAPPGYGVVNSMMADWPWAFGFEPNGARRGYSTDDTRVVRTRVCGEELYWEDTIGGAEREVDYTTCSAAGIGHPNPEGCRQAADTILRRYKRHVRRRVGTVADEFDRGTDSLRRSFGRFGLDVGGGVRYGTTHRVVDSLRTKLRTGSGARNGRQSGELYLQVYPGRNGSGERFRLDTEYNDTRPGGPRRTPDRDHAEDEFHVDPMMGRRLSGPPGNADGHEIADAPQFEPGLQTYHRGDRWDDRRLRLGDVEHATLVLAGVDPDSGWELRRVSGSLNGWLDWDRSFRAFDGTDTRCTGPGDTREFALASFNDVDGVSASDLDVAMDEGSLALGFSGGEAVLRMDVVVANTADVRVPGVAVEYGMRVKTAFGDFTGRDWQVALLDAVPAGGSVRRRVTLRTDEAGHVRTNNAIELACSAFVGTDRTTDAVRTRKREVRS